MSNDFPSADTSQRKSKQLATQNIVGLSRKRARDDDFEGSQSAVSSYLPESIYGSSEKYDSIPAPDIVIFRDLMRNAMLNTVSKMYFNTTDPCPEILRCMDDRIDTSTHRYVSGLETLLKNELTEPPANNKKSIKDRIVITPLDLIACPFRKNETIDTWTPLEVALFELGICENRGFSEKKMYALFEGNRSVEELLQFFTDVYSLSENYAAIQKFLSKDEEADSAESEKSS